MDPSDLQRSLEAAQQAVRRSERLAEQRDPDSTLDAVEALEALERCTSADEQLDWLESLDVRTARNVAWRLLALISAERMNQAAIYELMRERSWWNSYQTALSDPRLNDATSADLVRWALIHFRGGTSRYEQAVVKRSW